MSESASNKRYRLLDTNWKNYLFTYRSYTPIPFLVLMLMFAAPTPFSLAFGFATALAGELIRFWGVSYAGSETRTTGTVGGTQLVTSGPYAHVRNPLYVGNIMIYLGVGIMSNALVPYLQFIALVYFVFQYSAIVALEEEYLSQTFSNWKDYSSKVRRFVPSLRPFQSIDNLVPNVARAVRSERSSLIAMVSLTLLLIIIYVLKGAG